MVRENDFDELVSRLDKTEERVSELEGRLIENLKTECKENREWRSGGQKKNIQELWDNFKSSTV